MTLSRGALLLAALLFTANLWGYDFWAPDEPFFAEGAREMLVDGHWLVSHVNGVVNFHKPPLFFWLIALFSMPFGEILPMVARLISAAAALVTVFLTMRICGRDADARTATLSGAVLATTYLFWEKARWAQIDSLLCMLIWVALYCFSEFRAGRMNGRRAGLAFWGVAALAVLAKGPVGLLLPLGIALTTLAFDRRLALWRQFAPWAGPALLVVILGAWAYPASVLVEGYSVWGALQEHFISRGIHGLAHKQPWYYFGEVLPPLLLPWTGLLAGALVLAWRRRRESSTDRWLLVAVLFVLLFFTISTEKRELYALPALPAIALLVARFAGRVLGWDRDGPEPDRRWLTIGQGSVGALFVLAGAALPFVAGRVEQVSTTLAIVLGVPLVVAGTVALVMALRQRLLAATLAPMVGMAATLLAAVFLVYPAMNGVKSARSFSVLLKEQTAASRAAGHRVVAFDLANLPNAFAFFSDGVYTIETQDPGLLARHLRQPAQVYAVVNEDRLTELPAPVRESLHVVARTVLSRRNVALVANRSPAPGPRD